jgi:hypothetical protein
MNCKLEFRQGIGWQLFSKRLSTIKVKKGCQVTRKKAINQKKKGDSLFAQGLHFGLRDGRGQVAQKNTGGAVESLGPTDAVGFAAYFLRLASFRATVAVLGLTIFRILA